jgi:hypothetical protein
MINMGIEWSCFLTIPLMIILLQGSVEILVVTEEGETPVAATVRIQSFPGRDDIDRNGQTGKDGKYKVVQNNAETKSVYVVILPKSRALRPIAIVYHFGQDNSITIKLKQRID